MGFNVYLFFGLSELTITDLKKKQTMKMLWKKVLNVPFSSELRQPVPAARVAGAFPVFCRVKSMFSRHF